MSDASSSTNAEREMRRSVLGDALGVLGSASDKRRAADEVLRALDHYLEIDEVHPKSTAGRARADLGDELSRSGGPTRGAGMSGALTRYLGIAQRGGSDREPAVTNFDRPPGSDVRWARWIVLGCAAIASTTVAFTFSTGFVAGGLVLAIWVMALLALSFA